MAWSEADEKALREAIASGALRVRFVDREVTYRSLAEMRETLAMMQRGRRVRQVRPSTTKGFR